MRNLLERLEKDVLVADGAMGTALYGNGLESCHEYNNISNPDSVEKIHRAYIEAGADVIQTNTYAVRLQENILLFSVLSVQFVVFANAS